MINDANNLGIFKYVIRNILRIKKETKTAHFIKNISGSKAILQLVGHLPGL